MDESETTRVTVEEAARLLGIEQGSVKKRIQRGKIRSEKDANGTTWVYVDRSETVQDKSEVRSETDREELVDELRDRVRYLERQVEEERDARRRADTLLAQLMQRVPELEAPQTAQEPSEESESRPAPAGAQESAQRPWWRRVFGG